MQRGALTEAWQRPTMRYTPRENGRVMTVQERDDLRLAVRAAEALTAAAERRLSGAEADAAAAVARVSALEQQVEAAQAAQAAAGQEVVRLEAALQVRLQDRAAFRAALHSRQCLFNSPRDVTVQCERS